MVREGRKEKAETQEKDYAWSNVATITQFEVAYTRVPGMLVEIIAGT